MALHGLTYRNDSADFYETKAGIMIYGGSASTFDEWELRTAVRIQGTKSEDMPKLSPCRSSGDCAMVLSLLRWTLERRS